MIRSRGSRLPDILRMPACCARAQVKLITPFLQTFHFLLLGEIEDTCSRLRKRPLSCPADSEPPPLPLHETIPDVGAAQPHLSSLLFTFFFFFSWQAASCSNTQRLRERQTDRETESAEDVRHVWLCLGVEPPPPPLIGCSQRCGRRWSRTGAVR